MRNSKHNFYNKRLLLSAIFEFVNRLHTGSELYGDVIAPVHLTNQSVSLGKLGILILFEFIVTVCLLYPMFYIDKWLGLG